MGKKKRNNAEKKKNAAAPSASNPPLHADSSSSAPAPPIAKEEKQASAAVAEVSTSSEGKSTVAAPPSPIVAKEAEKQESAAVAEEESSSSERKSPIQQPPATMIPPGLMFAARLDSEGADPKLNQTAVVVYSDEMKTALWESELRYVKILASDSSGRVYELRLSQNDDVHYGGDLIIRHQWGKLVAENGLKEGQLVAGYGYDDFTDKQFRVLLSFRDGPPPPPENQDREADVEGRPGPLFLFEKKVDGGDREELAIECFTNKLEMALEKTPSRTYMRAFVNDPERNKYEMSLAMHRGEGGRCSFRLRHGWDSLAAVNGVEEGDLVTGTGQIAKHNIIMRLHIFKNLADKSNRVGKGFLLFEKKLEPADTDVRLGRLVVRSSKDVVRDAVDEADDGYVRVSTTDAKGCEYNDLRMSRYTHDNQEGEGAAVTVYVVDNGWGDVVTNNGLRSGDQVWCWGSFFEDGSIKTNIDVDQALEQSVQCVLGFKNMNMQ